MIFKANQWTVFYMTGTSVMKELSLLLNFWKNTLFQPAFTRSELEVVLMSLLLTILWTYFTTCSSVSVANIEHVIAGWGVKSFQIRSFSSHAYSFGNLTLSWQKSVLYRNQSLDLFCKSIDCFLYDRDLGYERVKANITAKIKASIRRFTGSKNHAVRLR